MTPSTTYLLGEHDADHDQRHRDAAEDLPLSGEPPVRFNDVKLQHRVAHTEVLSDGFEAELVEPAEVK